MAIKWRDVAAHSRWPLIIAAVVIVIDQLTKTWALRALGDGRTIDLVGSLRFNLAFNTGMAFSSGEGFGRFVPFLAVIVVVGLLVTFSSTTSRWSTIGVGLVIGGALGNVIDRIFRGGFGLTGAVVDFIDVQWWPIFNVADVALVCGAIMLLIAAFFGSKEPA